MAFSPEQLALLNADYTKCTSKPVQRFVCPITLKDEPAGELCDGHILNASIKTASRRTLVEYADVDRYFGTTIEPDVVAFLNVPVSEPKELLERYGRTLTVTLPSGEKADAFFANAKARPSFPRIDLIDTTGKTVASPYLRTTGPLEPKLHKGLQVEWLMGFNNSAMLGAMLKSAHLAMFRTFGYRHVLSPAGNYLREALAAFYNDEAGKEQASDYFAKFTGAAKPAMNDLKDDARNTLDHGAFMFHYEPGGADNNLLFAVSCLFIVNRRLVTVMVPYSMEGADFEATLARYEATLKDWTTAQDIHLATLEDGRIRIDRQPIKVGFGPQPGR